MKRILLLLTVVAFISCGSKAENKKVVSGAGKSEAKITKIDAAQYKQLLFDYDKEAYKYNGELPAIVDFYAVWCGPCKAMEPILDSLAKKYAGKVNFYKVDVDVEKDLATKHGIRSIPTMFFFPKEGEPQIVNGALPLESLDKAIREVLLKK